MKKPHNSYHNRTIIKARIEREGEMGSNSKSSVPSSPQHHAVLFPLMAQGHTIPLLQFAHLLLRRNIAVTVITTAQNRPFISTYLENTTASIIAIPFPQNIPQIPSGIENTDKLKSMTLLYPFAKATKLMQSDFEQTVENLLPRVTFIVSDSFLWWTLESATKFGVPRLVFSGMSCYCTSVLHSAGHLLHQVEKDDELVTVPEFPWIKIKRNDFDRNFLEQGTDTELIGPTVVTVRESYGMIVNSFYELESKFVDHLNREAKPKVWCVGPLCLADSSLSNKKQGKQRPYWIEWLDRKLEQGCSVLYVAFGTHAEISEEQVKEIAKGLEESEVNFLWVVRNKETKLDDGFEERVKNRGIVVREWVEQREILYHESVKGFLSHCGSSSFLESICAGVPILGWPLMADQPLNAMLIDEIKVGFRVKTSDGLMTGFVNKEELVKSVKELMEGEKGREMRKTMKELSVMANRAMEENRGSSWKTLDKLLWEISNSGKTEINGNV